MFTFDFWLQAFLTCYSCPVLGKTEIKNDMQSLILERALQDRKCKKETCQAKLCYLIFMHYATCFNCVCLHFFYKTIALFCVLAGMRILFYISFYLFYSMCGSLPNLSYCHPNLTKNTQIIHVFVSFSIVTR